MEGKEVTVVIPAYNAEKYLLETLVSIKNQSVLPKEVIVVDDASVDDTLKIAEEVPWGDSLPIKRMKNEVNKGIGATRNCGVSDVTTPYVAFLSSDDCYNQYFFEMCLPHVSEETATYTMYNRCNDKMKPLRRFTPPKATKENIIEWALKKNMFINFSCVILPTKIFRKAKFEEELRHGEDLIFLLDTVIAGLNWQLVPQPLLNYRLHGEQGTFTQRPEEFELLWNYLFNRFEKLNVNRHTARLSYSISKKKAFPPLRRRVLAWGYHKLFGYK